MLSELCKRLGHPRIYRGRKRVETLGLFQFKDGIADPPESQQECAVHLVRRRVVWVQFYSFLKRKLGSAPVPVEIHQDHAERNVRFGDRVVDLERTKYRGPGFRKGSVG